MKILADSNLIIYALNTLSPKSKAAQNYLIKETKLLCISDQNLWESLRVLTHPTFPNPFSSVEALQALDKLTLSIPVISPNSYTRHLCLELIKKYQLHGNLIFDAYLVATMLSNDIYRIATDNSKHFTQFEEIKIINPFTHPKKLTLHDQGEPDQSNS